MYTQAVAERDLADRTSVEYRDTILQHMIEMDARTRPEPRMIDMQPEIEWQMWPFLVEFMVDVHMKLRLEPQTLFLAVNIVNRYCSHRIVFRKHFQLVGTTALWIASKYEDKKSRTPSLRILTHLCCNNYEPELFTLMESHILNTLDWNVTHCTVDSFLGIINSGHATMPSPLLACLTSYIAEITLFHCDFIGVNPHALARAIHMLSLHLLNVTVTVNASQEETELLELLAELICTPPRSLAEKYSTYDRHQVTRLVDQYVWRRRRHEQELSAAAESQDSATNPQFNFASPLTPPPSVTRSSASSIYSDSTSDYTPPTSGSAPPLISDDSPLTVSSLDGSVQWAATIESLSSSPPATPLQPPKFPFRTLMRSQHHQQQ